MQAKIITLGLLGAALVVAVPATAAPSRHAATTTTITVKMTEFKFTLSRSSAPRGTVVFKIVNKGQVAHDFKINGKKTPLVAPGKSTTLTVKFKNAGKYPYLCTVAGHAASGMKGVFTIK